MKNNSKGKRISKNLWKIAGLTAAGIVLCLSVLFICFKILHPNKVSQGEPTAKNIGIRREQKYRYFEFEDEVIADAFISYMYDANVSGDFFRKYFIDITVERLDSIRSVRLLDRYTDELFARIPEDKEPSYFVLGLDPYAVFLQSCSNKKLYIENLTFLAELAENHPECVFSVILPDDSASKWNSLSAGKKADARLSYILLVRNLSDCPNINVYYHPQDKWILYTDAIRTSGPDSPLKFDITDHLLAVDVGSGTGTYLLRTDTVNTVMDTVIEQASEYEDISSSYADLTGKKVFFIGDSVFGNYRDETSIPTFFADMTGARVYNLGEGGVPAVDIADHSTPAGTAFDLLLGDTDTGRFDVQYSSYDSSSSYRLAAHDLEGSDGSDCIFMIEFGLNDYFTSASIEDFENAMNTITGRIRSGYPAARVILLAPGNIGLFDRGEISLREDGTVLEHYRNAVADVASNCSCEVISLKDGIGLTPEGIYDYLLPDYVHYNERGRFMVAGALAEYFAGQNIK